MYEECTKDMFRSDWQLKQDQKEEKRVRSDQRHDSLPHGAESQSHSLWVWEPEHADRESATMGETSQK